eukprot:GHVU01117107.1.p1 GENE.GHVU01117107.1~~GHVU01117107.1.p1  ORF type:complete len:105 (-),score=5.32 GHVU01117107.1:189-503(-)
MGIHHFPYMQKEPVELKVGFNYKAQTILHYFARRCFKDWFPNTDPTAETLNEYMPHFLKVDGIWQHLDLSNDDTTYEWKDNMEFLQIPKNGRQPGTGADVALLS